MKNVVKATGILFFLLCLFPILLMLLLNHALGAVIGIFVGMIGLQLLTKTDKSANDADV